MKSYLKAMSLWEAIESDVEPTLLPQNPTVAQIKKRDEEVAREAKALSCLHSAVSEEIFTTIMSCDTPKEAWTKIKEEFEGNQQTKLMQILNLKREFEMMRMKNNEGVKEYGSRLMSIVNQIKLLGGDFSSQRVVDKLLVTLPERYETKISSLEDTKDLSKLTVSELINSLHAVDQRRSMREEEIGGKNEGLLLAKVSSSKGTGNITNVKNDDKVEDVFDPACHEMLKELIEGFDESFNRTTQVWNPKVADIKVKPYAGQRFKNIDSCFDFYTEYGREDGFNVRKSSHKVRNGIIMTKYLVCQKEGTHETVMSKHSDSKIETSHSSSSVGMEIRRRNTVTKKCGCAAKNILKYIGPDSPDKYVISGFIEGHNHPLASESGKEFLHANRTMTAFQRHFLLNAVKSNMGAFRAHTMYKSLFGLYSDVGPTAVDFQNWMRDIKLFIGKHDADMLLQKFKNKHETSDGGFFYEFQTDSNGHLTRLFWADIRGRKNY
ncbi:hypothetical protein AgCh_005031 [Apium graveolens]